MSMTTERPPVHESVQSDRPRRHRTAPSRPSSDEVYRRRRIGVALAAGALVVTMMWAVSQVIASDPEPVATPAPVVTAAPVVAQATVPSQPAEPQPDLAALENVACTLDVTEVRLGDSGDAVTCVQTALYAATMYDGQITGTFDDATDAAVRAFQAAVDLYTDGIVGKNTATELGIWPGVEAFIVRTPTPAPGATDLWGMPLSPVASAGDDAPPLPQGHDAVDGKRVVYDRAGQRVWAIDDEGRVVRSYLVSGSQYRNEVPGVHTVYSKTESALGWDLTADLPYMIRYTQTERGHIGFHAIPNWRATGEMLQTVDELGQKLSGGCTRQALEDAQFLWEFADVGTKVVVI